MREQHVSKQEIVFSDYASCQLALIHAERLEQVSVCWPQAAKADSLSLNLLPILRKGTDGYLDATPLQGNGQSDEWV
jgi:hypothetical protein